MPQLRRAKLRRLVLDIGTSAIRLCELSQTKTGYQLTRYFQREVLVDPAADEEEKRTVRSEALKALLKDAKVRSKRVLFGVPGQSVFTRTRALPPVPEHKVTQIVRYEIQQQIPFSLDQIALDYQFLSRSEAGGYEVLMAAIKVDVVEKHLEIFRDVKRTIDTVDVAPFAAYNWLKHSGEFGDQGDCVALVDLGASTTDIVIERDNQFRFTRSLNLGGNDVTKAISDTFGMSFADAEKLKQERGFAPTGDPKRDGKGGEAVGRVLARLVAEISRSFAYFRSQPGGGPVSRVIVTGGGSCLRNIVPYLQRELGMEVRIAQPLAGLAIAPGAQEVNEHPEQAAVALGLALRCTGTVSIEINLIPPRILEMARRKEQALYWFLSLVTLALILASVIPQSHNKDRRVRENIEVLKQTLSSYDPALVMAGDPTRVSDMEYEYDRIRGVVGDFRKRTEGIDKAFVSRINWLKYLLALEEARPPGGGIVFSTVESTYIGFSTPEEARRILRGLAEGQREAGAETVDLTNVELPSTGFYGLRPSVVRGADSGRGGGRGGNVTSLPPTVPNGLTIYGFAKDHPTLLEYKKRLEESGAFIEGGVYFDDKSANLVAADALDGVSLPTGGGVSGRSPGPYEQSFRTFVLRVQFSGVTPMDALVQPDLIEAVEQEAGSKKSSSTSGGGGGGGRRRERRERDRD